MGLLIQRLIDGMTDGAIYASMALAIVLIFRATGTINLAQGEMGMFCAFVAWRLSDDHAGLGWPMAVATVGAVLVGAALGALIERTIMRRIEHHTSHLPAIIVTLGIFVAIDAIAGRLFTLEAVPLGSPFGDGLIRIGEVHILYREIGTLATMAVVAGAMWFLFERTRVGLAMRASVDNPTSAQLAGVRRGRMLMLGWALAGGLGALAAVLVAPTTLVQVPMMQNILLFSFAGAALGGFDSPPGAVIGGVLIGIINSLTGGYISFIGNQLNTFAALVIILLVLLFRPAGIFGRREMSRL